MKAEEFEALLERLRCTITLIIDEHGHITINEDEDPDFVKWLGDAPSEEPE